MSNQNSKIQGRLKSLQFKMVAPAILLGVVTILIGILSTISTWGLYKSNEKISSVYTQGIIDLDKVSANFRSIHRILYAYGMTVDKGFRRDLENECKENYTK